MEQALSEALGSIERDLKDVKLALGGDSLNDLTAASLGGSAAGGRRGGPAAGIS